MLLLNMSCAVFTVQGLTALEWRTAHAAALRAAGGADMFDLMGHQTCCLVMDWVPGVPLLKGGGPFRQENAIRTASDLGRCGNYLFWHASAIVIRSVQMTCPQKASDLGRGALAACQRQPFPSMAFKADTALVKPKTTPQGQHEAICMIRKSVV